MRDDDDDTLGPLLIRRCLLPRRPRFRLTWSVLVWCLALAAVVAMVTAGRRIEEEVGRASRGCSPPIVVSLATFGVRTFGIGLTVRSLLAQTMAEDLLVMVHVALESRVGSVPRAAVEAFLEREFGPCTRSPAAMLCGPRLMAVIGGPDWGPATKVLGALPLVADGDACIVSVDDDMGYDPRLVETLASRAPHDAALGLRCEEVPPLGGAPLFWNVISGSTGWLFPFDDTVLCKGWLSGFQGVVYRRRFFGDDAWAFMDGLPRGCFYADDVRLSGYLWAKGIRRYVHPHFVRGLLQETYTERDKNASDALSLAPNTMRDRQWPCVQHFGWDA